MFYTSSVVWEFRKKEKCVWATEVRKVSCRNCAQCWVPAEFMGRKHRVRDGEATWGAIPGTGASRESASGQGGFTGRPRGAGLARDRALYCHLVQGWETVSALL